MKHQPVSCTHCLNLPHDKLRPPTNQDRVRVSRQKQNPAQKEVARIKNKNRSMVLYHKQTPCQREITLKQRSERKKKRRAKDNANNPNFCPWKKLDHLTPQEKEKRKSIKRQQQQTERIAKSYYIAPTTDDIATSLAVQWCNTDLLDMYEDLIVRIAPLSNPAKHTHQTGQPIRIFYSRTNKNTTWDENVNKRALYGVAGIMATTCYDMNNFKVLPFTTLIEELADQIERDHEITVLSLEIKAYQGGDVFIDKSTQEPFINVSGEHIRVKCNDRVGQHNDNLFDLNGVQSAKDTSMGGQNIVTLSIGSTRDLTFVHLVSNKSNTWRDLGKREVFSLHHGSTFILVPEDEIPQLVNGSYYKTQHSARFSGRGLSFAFVFWLVDRLG